MKKVYSARDEIDAHLARNLLDENGIEAIVQAQALSGILGAIPVSEETLPSIWVRDEDEPRALELLSHMKAGEPPPARADQHPWTCPKCGEQIEGQFTECWNCGTSRPA